MSVIIVLFISALLIWRYITIRRLNANLVKTVAERELAEEALRNNESFLNSVLDGIQNGISVVDKNFNILHTNSALKQFYPEIQSRGGRKCYEAFHGRTKPCEDCTAIKSFMTGTIQSDTVSLSDSGGESKWVEITAYPVKDGNGNVTSVIENFCDITERKRAEEELQSARLLLENSFNSLDEAVFIVDPDARSILFCNPAVERIFGYTPEEVLGRNTEFLHVDKSYYEEFGRMLVPALDSYGVFSTEFKTRRKDGTVFFTDHSVTEIKDESGKRTALVNVVSDITERKRAEMELRSAKQLMDKTFASLNEALFVANPASRTIIACNTAAERLFGYSEKEMVGRNTEFLHVNRSSYEEFGKKLLVGLEQSDQYRCEYRMSKRDGTNFLCDYTLTEIRDESGKCTELIGVFTDITEKRLMEQELLKAQKLESLSLLAGGIAHDFNNILMGILGNISLAKFLTRSEKKTLKILGEAEKAAIRARGLTNQLLTFSTGGTPLKNVAKIKDLLTEISQFALRGSKSKAVNLLDKNLATVNVDRDQITQVFNNLLINADQAVPEGGTITMRGKNLKLTDDEEYNLPGGQYVKISVEDNGVGIPPNIIDRIFDPFFTTKSDGNGLGLSTSYSIIKNHGGLLKVTSRPGEGSTFHVYLPAADKPVRQKSRDKIDTQGSGKILVMDDDELVRDVLAEMLSVLGYQSELARDGEEAEKKYTEAMQTGEHYVAVILDLTVRGGMGGKQAMEKLKEIDPNVNAIVASGYSTDIVVEDYGRFGFSGYVTKPFELKTLSKVLSKTIRSSGQTGPANI